MDGDWNGLASLVKEALDCSYVCIGYRWSRSLDILPLPYHSTAYRGMVGWLFLVGWSSFWLLRSFDVGGLSDCAVYRILWNTNGRATAKNGSQSIKKRVGNS